MTERAKKLRGAVAAAVGPGKVDMVLRAVVEDIGAPLGYCVRLRCDDLPPSYQGTFYGANERDAAEEDAEAMRHGPGDGWKAEVVPLYAPAALLEASEDG